MRSRWLGLLLLLLVLASCAGANDQAGHPDAAGALAGFWRGLWHGMISPIAFLISLFTDRVAMYEIHNTGRWYDFGFLLGIAAVFGSGAARRAAALRSGAGAAASPRT